MASSIPASAIVNVLPSVISAGGTGLDIVGVILTNNARMPTGAVVSFSSPADVAAYFGPISQEASLATTYFAGYDGSTIKPASLKFFRYVDTAAAAYLRGGDLSTRTISQIQSYSGTLIVTINGTVKTSSAINLSAATDMSNAATIIQAGFTTPGFTVTYDALSASFLFTSSTTGAASTITTATGTLASNLRLSSTSGAIASQGSDVMTPASGMDALTALSQDFVSFMTAFEPNDTNKVAFAAWTDSKSDRFAYICWDNLPAASVSGDTTSVGVQIKTADYTGTACVYDPTNGDNVAAFVLGALASIDFTRENGRATLAFRNGNIAPGVTNQSIAANLIANGYNFVGAYATANDQFAFLYPGSISGQFKWIDSWVGQVWMNNAFQLALMGLLTGVGQIPYNRDGYALIEGALRGVIDDAVNFGAIRAGVTLSASQRIQVNNSAGFDIATTLERRGWYVLVKDPGATVRGNRGSPVTTVFYTDGQSVQTITLSSVNVQ